MKKTKNTCRGSHAHGYPKNKGITLVALVITIIILLILVIITIGVLNSNGIIAKSKESKFKQTMSSYKESIDAYVLNVKLNKQDASLINAGMENGMDIKEIIPDFNSKLYNQKVIVKSGIMYYVVPEVALRTKKDRMEIKWCGELGINICCDVVELYEDYEKVNIKASTWMKVNGVSYYTPEISKFSTKNTYYVDNDGTVVGRIDRIKAPSNWYDYKEKEWANVVTVNGKNVAYWVWIPRYEYKLNNTTQKADIKFIQIGQQVDEGYEIPESFTFGGVELTGYWISKYQLSNNTDSTNAGFNVDIGERYATITSLDKEGEYKIFVDGKLKATAKLPYALDDLRKDIMYNIMLVGPDGIPIGEQDICSLKNELEAPDISKFNPKSTYYVDSNGKVIGRMDKVDAPINWYDYNNKLWANVVTVTDNNVAYWVWIPRYEYKLSQSDQKADIKFIPKTQIKANSGYEIPESFTFGGVELSGFWISKYELSTSSPEILKCNIGTNTIKINSFNENDEKKYSFFIDGKEYNNGESYMLPYTITDLKPDTTYNIMVMDNATGQPVLERDIATYSNYFEKPDISKFNPGCTYYVSYNNKGEEIRTQITENEPNNWYNYSNSEWANIVTTGGDKEAYWVWIPRYEYKLYNQSQRVTVKYISKNQTSPDEGYEIPESFSFGGKNLGGYWMSKYELSSK